MNDKGSTLVEAMARQSAAARAMDMEADTGRHPDWEQVRNALRTEIGDAAFKSWIHPLSLDCIEGGYARFTVPNRSLRDWVVTHYADRIRSLWSALDPRIAGIEVEVGARSAGPAVAATTAPAQEKSQPAAATELAERAEPSDDGLSAALDTRFTFDNFVVGDPNQLAYAAARRVAEADEVPFNPLFLYGGVGLGKTHLMHAIAWRLKQRRPDRRVIYVSAEKFMYQFVRAVQYRDTVAFKEQFRSVDVLMIDDIQFICGKESTQDEFFHTFNALVDQNRQVVISADKSPSDLDRMEERLRSRLGWGLVADIHPTTYELRLGILRSKADRLAVDIPQKVMEFLALRISSNVRELEGALNRIVAHADLMGRPITLEMTEDALRDLLRANDRRPSIDQIQRQVAAHYRIKLSEMFSASRARALARPRQVAMYLCKQLTTSSLPTIGRQFGGRDHTTVMHAVNRIEELKARDESLAEDIELLRRTLMS